MTNSATVWGGATESPNTVSRLAGPLGTFKGPQWVEYKMAPLATVQHSNTNTNTFTVDNI